MGKVVEYIGIDFGSANVCVVGILDEGEMVVFNNGKEQTFPTYYRLDEKGGKYFFSEAIESGIELMYDIKESMFGNEYNEGFRKIALESYIKELFDKIKEIKYDIIKKENYDFDKVERIVFGFPSYNVVPIRNENFKTAMTEILKEIFPSAKSNIWGIAEPIALGYACVKSNKVPSNEKMMVVDFGGFSMDILPPVKANEETIFNKIKYKTESVSQMRLGKDITFALGYRVYGKALFDDIIEKAKCSLFVDKIEEVKCSLFGEMNSIEKEFYPKYDSKTRYKSFQIKYDKEFYPKYDSKTRYKSFQIKYDNENHVITLSCSKKEGSENDNFEYKVKAYYDEYLSVIKKYMSKSGKKITIVFSGGMAKMKPLRDYIIKDLNDTYKNITIKPLWIDSKKDSAIKLIKASEIGYSGDPIKFPISSKNAIAYGAALCALGNKKMKQVDNDDGGCEDDPEEVINRLKSIIIALKRKIDNNNK